MAATLEAIDRAFPSPPPSPALSLRGVRFGYRPGHDILRGLDVSVSRGAVVAVMGANGSGKTTLL
ncbi:MAG: ATP-binding cassette domain-containing protein, partial [Methanobacteriota archaeon]